jgi:hypothetical protein
VTATEIQIAHAAEAVQLGQAAAAAHMAAAAATPGLGFQVALPSVPGPFGPPRGEGYNVPESVPALRPVAHVAAQPSYGSPLVGGQPTSGSVGFLAAMEGIPAPVYRSSPSPSTSGVLFVSASPRTPLLDRIKAAFGVLLGRR